MRGSSRILFTLAFLILLFFAVWPYVPAIREEWSHLYTAWQQVRNGSSVDGEVPNPAAVEETPPRERTLTSPQESALETELTESAESEDPLLAEARRLAQEDPEAAMLWLQEQHSGPDRLRGMLEVVAIWAAEDSESALLWLESNAQGLARIETFNSGIALWAERDPTVAAAWIDGMANDGSKVAATRSLAATWAKTNPEAAAAWVNDLPLGAVRNEAASALALSWLESDSNMATEWAIQEAVQTGNDQMLEEVFKNYTNSDLEGAEAFIRSIDYANPYLPGFLDEHIAARAKENPLAAAEWIANLSEDDPLYFTSNTTRLMEVWTETDSIAASTWLSEQESGPERDAAIIGFTETIQEFEPAVAIEWAAAISDPEARSARIASSFENWLSTNQNDAIDWLNHSELADEIAQGFADGIISRAELTTPILDYPPLANPVEDVSPVLPTELIIE